MTEQPSLTAVEYDRAPSRETDITIERLEFGKFCVSSDGPIESNRDHIPIEHSQLGRSSGFPEELISICHPTRLGIVQEDNESLPRDNLHGTVLRPVVRGDKDRVRQVFYRVRWRAEDGEGKSGRRYTLARYLVVPGDDVNALTMLAAMNSVPLGGITRAAASDISAFDLESEKPKLDPVGQAFLREALIYIVSGVALSITEDISEAEFFTWVASVHNRLPPALRPHLSAGWNVGSSYSGKLGITYTTHRSAMTALFAPSSLTWSAPEYVTTWPAPRQPVVNSFFEARLEPGRMFEQYVLMEASLSQGSSSAEERPASLAVSLPPVELSELPQWDHQGVVRTFRYPGLQAQDYFKIRALAEWLASGEDSARGCFDARQLSFRPSRLKALTLIFQALAEPASRVRADQALWLSITGKVPTSFANLLEGAAGAGARRARLIAAIGSGDVFNTLSALQAAPPKECEELPGEAASSLLYTLDQSLTQGADNASQYHCRLLLSPPPQYREWAGRRALELMRALAFQEDTFQKALAAIVEINGSETVRALYCLITGKTLTSPVENGLRRLQPEERSIFIELLNHRWARKDELTATRREVLLDWFRVLQPEENRHPLLRLAAGAKLTDSDVSEIADDVELEQVPKSLLLPVAQVTLQRWSVVLGRRIISGGVGWLPVTNLWPRIHARVLGAGIGTKFPDPKIARIAQQLRLGFTDLEYLLTIWLSDDRFRDAAALVWDSAIQLEPRIGYPFTAIDLCRHFVNGRLPDGEFTSQELCTFVKLVRESGRGDLAAKSLQSMWQFASSAWQVSLLLTLFPQNDLEPTPAQLSLLIPHRDWLRSHLDDKQTRFDRRGRFQIATQPFHSQPFRRNSAWRDEFVRSPIWAAFRGVPVSTLPPGALRAAIRAYSGSGQERTGAQPEAVILEQTRFCLTFLRSYEGAASEDGAMRRVVFDFVLPLFNYRWGRERFEAALAWVGADMKLPGYTRNDKYYDRFDPTMYDLIRQILTLCDRKSLSQMIKEFYRKSR